MPPAMPKVMPRELVVLTRLLARPDPFTAREALADGATYPMLRRFVREGLVAHAVRGVYHRPDVEDTIALRIAVLRRIVPADCVVTDRSAGWLWGAKMILEPGAHRAAPDVQVFCPPGRRLRIGLVSSGERMLAAGDVVELDGLRVTTPLRTTCDLGRLLHRDQALAAMDSLAALRAFDRDQLLRSVHRFKGYRGVIQLRILAPLVDPLAGSPGESILRLRWLDAGLPRPTCQVPVASPTGARYYVDLGLPEHCFGAEYDGAEFHGEAERTHDEARRRWLRDRAWTIVVVRAQNIHGRLQDAERMLRRAWEEHQKRR